MCRASSVLRGAWYCDQFGLFVRESIIVVFGVCRSFCARCARQSFVLEKWPYSMLYGQAGRDLGALSAEQQLRLRKTGSCLRH